MRRGRLLAVVGSVVALSGCSAARQRGADAPAGPLFELQMSPVNATEIARRQVDPVSEYPPSWKQATKHGEATYRAEGRNPPDKERLVRANQTIYALSFSRRGSADVTTHKYTVEFEATSSADTGQFVRYSRLPAVDQQALAEVGLKAPPENYPFGIGSTVVYTSAERDASVLFPSPETRVIKWPSGAQATMTVVSTSRAEVIRYHINATAVGSLKDYGQQFQERAAFTLTGLSDAEERIVQKAITNEDGYAIHAEADSNTPGLPSGATQLAERFAAHENKTFERNVRFEDGSRIFHLVTYNNQTYWTDFNINRMEI